MQSPYEVSEQSRAPIGAGERLLLSAWRKIVVGQSDCPLVAWEFSILCGEDSGEVLAAVFTFMHALAYAGRRRLHVGHPGCAGVTGDERQLLALVAAAQHDHPALFDAHMRWLARGEQRHVAAIAAVALGAALGAQGLQLPLPVPCSSQRADIPEEPETSSFPLLQLIRNSHKVVIS